jgi:hypothetical protein
VRNVRRAIGTQATSAGFGQVLQEFNPTGGIPSEQCWSIGTGIWAHVHENLAQLCAHKDSSVLLVTMSVHFEQILSQQEQGQKWYTRHTILALRCSPDYAPLEQTNEPLATLDPQ